MTAFICPLPLCGHHAAAWADTCDGCGSPLREVGRIGSHAARLFNEGLAAARSGQALRAREHFAAVVHWYPRDLEARNALAYSYLESGEAEEARRHWAVVLELSARNALALRGMELAQVRALRQRSTRRKPRHTSRKARR